MAGIHIPNLQPPPSNPRPCEVSSGPEGNISSPIENFNAHDDLSKMEVSQEAVATNSDFYSNSAPTSDLALTYYSDIPWQADEPQADKDGSSKCENGDFSHLAKHGLTTSSHFPSSLAAALQEIKEDCEILAPSFLENYSDVSSCSDENTNETEMRPSCKYMKSLDQKIANHANLITTKRSPSEWPFTPTGNMSISAGFPTPQMSETPLILPIPFDLYVEARNMADCAEQKIETKENTSEGCVHSTSSSPKNLGTENDQEDNAGTGQTLKFVVEEKTVSIQEKELNIMPGSQKDVAEDITDRYSDECGKQPAYPEVDKCHEKKPLVNIHLTSFLSVGKDVNVKIHETDTELSDMNQDNRKEYDSVETISSSTLHENGIYESSDAMISSNIECAGLFDGSVSHSQDPIDELEDNTGALEAVKIHKAVLTQPSSENCQQDTICSNHVEDSKHDSMDACYNKPLSDSRRVLEEIPESESICGKTFITSENLEDHQRCHLGEKPHECAECESPLNQPKLFSSVDKEKILPNILTATKRPEEDAFETIEESLHETSSSFEQSDLGMYHGEPLSREITSCADSELSQSDHQSPLASLERSNLTDLEVQLPELKSSLQLQKKLQPIVILETLEPVTGNREYRCTECQHSTQNVDNIIEHYHTHSQHGLKFCPTSNSYLLSGDPQSKHGFDVSSNIVPGKVLPKTLKKKQHFKCTLCSHVSHRFYHHVQHTRTHTGITPFKCKGCNQYFSQSSCLYRHVRIPGRCRGSKPMSATHLKSKKSKMTKQKLAMDTKVAECKLLPDCYVKLVDICKKNVRSCDTVTSSKMKMKNKHVFSEHTVKGVGKESENIGADEFNKYKCPLCPRVFKYSYNRSRHLRGCIKEQINGGKWKIGSRHQCPLCKANFSFANNRARHIQNNCLRNYAQPMAKTTSEVMLEKENQTSTSTKPDDGPHYKCKLCPARFFHQSGKYKHLRKHELYKLTGKIVKYKSFPIKRFKQETSSSKNTVNCADTSTSNKANQSYDFSCSFCGKGFSKALSLRNHERIHKGDKPFLCLECGQGFSRHDNLINHKMIHKRRIQCTVCKKVLQTISELIIHRKTHLKRGKLKCPYCPMQFDYPAYLLRHLPSHKHQEQQGLDNAKIPKVEPESSLQSLHQLKVSKCTLCKKVFKDPQSLRKHCLKHITESSSKCPFCDRFFNSRRCLVRHIEKHSGDKPFPCHDCGKRFHRILNLEQHKKICSANKLEVNQPVVVKSVGKAAVNGRKLDFCPYCQRTFSRKNRFKKHLHGHKTNSLLSCSKCNSFYGRTKLTQHEKICNETAAIYYLGKSLQDKAEEKVENRPRETKRERKKTLPHMCPHCPQRFQYPSLLLRHLISHRSAYVHCGHQFGNKSMRIKQEESCVFVGKDDSELNSYNQPRLLRTTSVNEANDKKTESEYKCKFCTKTFLKGRNLRRHILTHTEVKPYRCKACDSCFSRYDHLKLHQTRCKGKRQRLEVCLPKISLDAVGKGWQKQSDGLDIAEEQTHECRLCLKVFTSKSNLARHVTMLHNRSKSSSRRCKNIASSTGIERQIDGTSATILEHYSIKRQSYACGYCPRSFRSSWQLKVHTRLHTGEKPYCCDNCGEKFIRRDYLMRHSFKCNPSKCGNDSLPSSQSKELFPKESLEIHQESSVSGDLQKSTERPSKGFSCAYCNSTFLIFSQLQQHFLTAHKQDSVKSPASTTSLQQHLSNIGTIKEEALQATNDYKQINGDGNLLFACNTHVEHAEEKPFPCSFCNFRFKNKSGLGGHLRTHLNSAPYSCSKCMRRFWNKNHQRSHLRKCRRLEIRSRRNVSLISSEIDSAQNDSVLVFKEGTKITHRGTGVLQTEFSCKDYPGDSQQEDQLQTSPAEKKPVHYQCSECDKSFTDGLMLISHLEDHGRVEQKKNCHTCPECGKVCNNGANLERHIKAHGIDKTFSCLECSTRFTSLRKLLMHKKHHKKQTSPFVCKICSQRFWTNKSLLGHFSVNHPDEVHSCKLCSKRYTLRHSLMRHCKTRHHIWQLDQHSDYSENEESIDHGSVSVSGCSDKESKSDEDGEVENDGESSDSDAAPYFPCHVCGKTFITSENLEDHQRCHLGEKPHECAECGKCFFQASQLLQHQRMHKSEFQCQTCHRGFISLFALRKHKHTHGKNRPYRCSKCDLSFKGHSQLAEHMAMHREDNFPCDICNCTFSCKSSRAEHRRSHSTASGDLPPLIFEEEELDNSHLAPVTSQQKYRCGVCHQYFEDTQELSEHGCLPAKERPFECSVCDQHFLHESHLEEHKKINHKLQSYEYQCNQCHICFSSEKTYLNHARRHEHTVAKELVLKKDVVENGNVTKMVLESQACNTKNTDSVDIQIPLQINSLIHECKICKLTFPTDAQIKNHEHCHNTADTQFECTGCGQNFLGSDAFREHHCLRSLSDFSTTPKKTSLSPTHGEEEEIDVTGDDVFNCFSCSEQFSTKSCLLEHQNECHPKVQLKCDICGKTFKQRRDLKQHKRTHLTEREARGTVKKKKRIRFQGSTVFDSVPEMALKTHGVKDDLHFRCDMCYRSFSQLSLLKQHLESHVGQVVYECTECDKAFAFPYLLEEHQLTHAGPSK